MRTPCIHVPLLAALVIVAAGAAPNQPKDSKLPERTSQRPADPKGSPPIFARMTFEEALKSIEGTPKILVVKATAEWCSPCKAMDRTTWRDEKVIQWFKDNGVAIAVDVDKLPDTAQRLNVQAMPTMVAFREGKELDRVVGLRTGEQLITWLESAKRGERESDVLRKKTQPGPDGAADVDARYKLARQLAQEGQHEKAAEEYAWLWDNALKHSPAMVGVRGSFMASEMERLAAQNAAAKARFVALRDKAHALGVGHLEAVDDLIVLNKIVGEEDRTLAWFDKAKADPAMAPVIQRSSFRLEELLESNDRWLDMGKYLFVRPLETAQVTVETNRIAVESAARAPAGMQDMMKATQERSYNQHTSRLYASLLAAKRDTEADEVIVIVAQSDPGGRAVLACITRALEIGEAREAMRKHLDAAWKKGAGIKGAREGLKRALGK